MTSPSPGGRRWAFVLGFAVTFAAAGVVTALVLFAPSLGPTAPPGGVAARGAALYQASCASCHGGATGGGMMDYPPRHNANGHTWHHSDCELVEVIRTGTSPMTEMMREMMAPPGAPTMPAWRDRLTDEEIDAVLAYIKTMWTEDQRASQGRTTREQCRA